MFGALSTAVKSVGSNINLPMGMAMAGGGTGSEQTSSEPKEDNQTILKQIATNTATTVAILSTAVLGTPGEQRDEGIEGGETDPTDKPGLGDRFKGALSGVGSALSKVNPFSSNFAFGNFGKALLAGGGLLLLKIFGEQLIDPLANLLQTIKDGKIGEKITDTYTALKEKAIPIFTGIKDNTITFIENAKKVFGLIQGAYQAVEAYVMSFDTKGKVVEGGPLKGLVIGDGILDEQEMSNLKDDIQTRITDAVVGFIGNLVGQLADGIRGIFLLPVTLGLAMAAIKYAIIGPAVKPPQGPTKKGTPIKAKGGVLRGILGKAGLVAAITFGVFELIDKSKEAYADAITNEMGNKQNFDFSEMVGQFFGGSGKGIFNSFGEMFKQGAIGTAIGGGLGLLLAKAGFVIGTPFGPLGMGTGALLGFLIGSLIGAIGGYFGGEKISKMLDDFGGMISDAGDAIMTYFSDLVDSVKSYFTGSTTRKDTDLVGLNEELDDVQEEIAKNEARAEKGFNYFPRDAKRLEYLKGKEKELLDKIDRIDIAKVEYSEGVSLAQLTDSITAEREKLKIMKQRRTEAIAAVKQQGFSPEMEREQIEMVKDNYRYGVDGLDGIETIAQNIADYERVYSMILNKSGADLDKFKLPTYNRSADMVAQSLHTDSGGGSLAISDKSVKDSYNQQHTNILDGLSMADQSTARMLGLEAELVKGRL